MPPEPCVSKRKADKAKRSHSGATSSGGTSHRDEIAMTTIRASASGARIQGDDYQHIYAWWQALRLLTPGTDVIQIEVEALSAGNVDDVVVRRTSGPDEYTQVKYSVDARKPVSSRWFTTRGTGAGSKSPLERFMASWQHLKSKGRLPDLLLFTNRVLDPTDPVLKLRRGTTGTLGQRLATPRSRGAPPRGRRG